MGAAALFSNAAEIERRLLVEYPDAHCELDFATPLQLLEATILSAQCTDKRVNMVTPELFKRYPSAAALADANMDELETVIRSTGFYRNKAKSLVGMAQALVDDHGGEVPRTMAELIKLPGVGRKTANVVLNVAFGEKTIAVDTHIFRVANRTGLAPGKTPLDVERGLEKIVPDEFLEHAHHWLILHGRYICVARTPKCGICPVFDLCRYKEKTATTSAALVPSGP